MWKASLANGFTVLELTAVLAILGILVGLFAYNIRSIGIRSLKQDCLLVTRIIGLAEVRSSFEETPYLMSLSENEITLRSPHAKGYSWTLPLGLQITSDNLNFYPSGVVSPATIELRRGPSLCRLSISLRGRSLCRC